MSWKEFKKKKEQEETNNTNTSIKTNTTTNNNTSQMSSWQKFKKEKKEKNLQGNTITKSNDGEQKNTIWEEVGNFADGAGKVADNLWQGIKSGVMSLQQTVGRAANDTQADSADLNQQMYEKLMLARAEKNPKEKEQIAEAIEKYSEKEDKIREESKEYYNKIQQKKDENTLKIQENAESINNPIGTYIAGEIAPRHRTNVTRYGWWSSWNNLFYWFSNGKLL